METLPDLDDRSILETLTRQERFELGRDIQAEINKLLQLLSELNDISERENW